MACSTFLAYANSYFELSLNGSYSNVKSILDKTDASYGTAYGYKAYSNLPMIKVNSYTNFMKYGTIKQAWLYFNTKKKLYDIYVV